ncbi:MAG TPA: beta-aspartyl-peptidase [Planctomycetota bacterium]
MITLLVDTEVFAPNSLGRRCLAVCGGQVVWMGKEELRLPGDLVDERIDLGGRRLIPGLIDCHAHPTGGGGEAGPATRVPPLPISQFTRGGTTTVIGLLGTDDLVHTPGELVATCRGLEAEGLNAWCWTGGYHVPPATLTGSVRGDLVHVDRILGVGELALSDHRSSQPTLEQFLHVAAECHVGGLMSGKAGVLHLHLGDGERGLAMVHAALEGSELPARIFHPTHVNRRKALFDEALELVERGCTIDLTAFPVGPGEDAWSASAALRRYFDAGLPADRVTVSSDGGGCLPEFDADGRVTRMAVGRPAALGESLAELLHDGLDLEQVLPAYTANPAKLLRLAGKGRIGVGADADLVVLDADGLARDVMVRGRWHLRGGESCVLGSFETGASAAAAARPQRETRQ